MSETPQYDYKFVQVTSEADDDGNHSISGKEILKEIKELGLQGWMVRSHTIDHVSKPMLITYILVKKL